MTHRGFTIIEILLALLILGGAAAVIGQISRSALQNAQMSRDLTQAELLAESILAKVQLGIIEMEAATDVPVNSRMSLNDDEILDTNAVVQGSLGDILWSYSLEVETVDDYGLVQLAVTVRQNLPVEQQPAVCRLVRWFALEPEEETAATSNTSTGQ
jgi:prepilin-type N-terminal cleavage/methylation domain-containing protein